MLAQDHGHINITSTGVHVAGDGRASRHVRGGETGGAANGENNVSYILCICNIDSIYHGTIKVTIQFLCYGTSSRESGWRCMCIQQHPIWSLETNVSEEILVVGSVCGIVVVRLFAVVLIGLTFVLVGFVMIRSIVAIRLRPYQDAYEQYNP